MSRRRSSNFKQEFINVSVCLALPFIISTHLDAVNTQNEFVQIALMGCLCALISPVGKKKPTVRYLLTSLKYCRILVRKMSDKSL